MPLLAAAAQTLAVSDAPVDSLEPALAAIERELGPLARIERTDTGVSVTWTDGGHDDERAAFADGLAALVALALRAGSSGTTGLADAQTFAAAVDRIASAARFRGARMAVAVFEVEGVVLEPGVDVTGVLERIGSAARSCVRGDDVVGHLGAANFALLFPRAGTFEARAAFRRVRDAVLMLDQGESGLACGQAGFAELEQGQTGAQLLAEARGRLNAARLKSSYVSPGGGSGPVTPLAG
jgi:hypothetical protein